MNFVSSLPGESPKFINFGISSVNATGKSNSVFAPSNKAESLNDTGGGLKGDWLASSYDIKRVIETKAYSNHIKKSELETRNVFERENIQTENIPLARQPDFVTPLPDNPQTRST